MITSVTYALKSIRRNFRRSFTLMFGVIISLAIVSGVLFYVDSTSGELVQAAVADVHIDTAISDTSLSENETKLLQDFVKSDVDDIIIAAEIIAGTKPFGPNTVGAIAAANDQFNLTSDIKSLLSAEGNFTPTYIFGLEPSYLEELSIFSTIVNISHIFDKDEILISDSLAGSFIDDTDNTLNISLVSFEIEMETWDVNLVLQASVNLTVGGTVNFDTAAMEEVNYAFDPESLEGDIFYGKFRDFTQVSNCILMSYENYMDLIQKKAGTNEEEEEHD